MPNEAVNKVLDLVVKDAGGNLFRAWAFDELKGIVNMG